MHRNLDDVVFTIFDTETTGLEPKTGDRIVEIAAVKIRGRERLSLFQSLVNPGRPISEAAFAVNKITPDMLKDAPDINTVMPGFIDFIRGSCLCSYNATFDLDFLNNELKLTHNNLPEDTMVVDVLKMSRRLMPGLERYALWFVADKLGIKNQQKHRALSDVELTLEVFNKLRNSLAVKGAIDFNNFASLFSINLHFLENTFNQKVSQIQEAMNLGAKLKIKYISSLNAEISERQVIPKEIRQEKSGTYLVGFCYLRNEERTFRVDGILHLEVV